MKVIVPLRARTWQELAPKLDQITDQVDIVELWLDQLFIDLMRQPRLVPQVTNRLKQLKSDQAVQILAVCKSPAENGQFGGTPGQRVEILNTFLQLGGDFIDLDIQHNPTEVIRPIAKDRLWLSLHDFEGIPNNLESLVRDMKTRQPAVYKFAVTPQNEAELASFIAFAQNFSQEYPAIFTTMGPLGTEGRERLKTCSWGGFYALNDEETTASGQPKIQTLSSKL